MHSVSDLLGDLPSFLWVPLTGLFPTTGQSQILIFLMGMVYKKPPFLSYLRQWKLLSMFVT